MRWSTIWAWLRTWEGAVPAAVAVSAAVYYGPRKMLETWRWYWEQYDEAVLRIIEKRKIIPGSPYVRLAPSALPTETPYSSKEIADTLKRGESWVIGSLKRLEKRRKAEPYLGGWRLTS
jgi:hypothetical protein